MSEGLNIYQRIHKIMEDVSYVQKEDKKVNNQYKFVSHDAVTAAIRPALLKHGVQAIPSYFDISADGNRTNCSMSITLVNIDQPEDRIVIPCAGFGQGIDPQDKGAGKAMSYAYKYALLKIFALETGDDPEKDNIDYVPPKVSKAPKVDNSAEAEKLYKQIKQLLDINIAKAKTKDTLLNWWNAPDSKQDRAKLKALSEKDYLDIKTAMDSALMAFNTISPVIAVCDKCGKVDILPDHKCNVGETHNRQMNEYQ